MHNTVLKVDFIYLIYYFCRNGTLCLNCTKLLSFTRWSRQRAEESHYTHGPGGAASAWKRAKNCRRHLEQGIPSVISSRIEKSDVFLFLEEQPADRPPAWPGLRGYRLSMFVFCLREANMNTSYHNSQRQKKDKNTLLKAIVNNRSIVQLSWNCGIGFLCEILDRAVIRPCDQNNSTANPAH